MQAAQNAGFITCTVLRYSVPKDPKAHLGHINTGAHVIQNHSSLTVRYQSILSEFHIRSTRIIIPKKKHKNGK